MTKGLGEAPLVDGLHYLEHRLRVKDKFRERGAEAFADYELLELLLFYAIPRKDVRQLAKALIATFGSYADVMSASPERLQEVNGIGDSTITYLKVVQASAQRLARVEVMNRPVLSAWSKVIDYCRNTMAREEREQFRILFLDKKNQLIADRVQQIGTIDHTMVYPREVMLRAGLVGATAIILVHNHPSGDPTPSPADVDMTRQIIEVGKGMNVMVHDHIIIGRNGHTSFRQMKLI